MTDLVLVDIADRVATITVNDPDRRNSATASRSEGRCADTGPRLRIA